MYELPMTFEGRANTRKSQYAHEKDTAQDLLDAARNQLGLDPSRNYYVSLKENSAKNYRRMNDTETLGQNRIGTSARLTIREEPKISSYYGYGSSTSTSANPYSGYTTSSSANPYYGYSQQPSTTAATSNGYSYASAPYYNNTTYASNTNTSSGRYGYSNGYPSRYQSTNNHSSNYYNSGGSSGYHNNQYSSNQGNHNSSGYSGYYGYR